MNRADEDLEEMIQELRWQEATFTLLLVATSIFTLLHILDPNSFVSQSFFDGQDRTKGVQDRLIIHVHNKGALANNRTTVGYRGIADSVITILVRLVAQLLLFIL
jgi:hypothetical protein